MISLSGNRGAPQLSDEAPPRLSQETGHGTDPLHLHLTKADKPACQTYARVTIMDSGGACAPACPRHAVAALDGITGAHVDWADSRGLNQWERTALELSEERSKLAYGIGTIRAPR